MFIHVTKQTLSTAMLDNKATEKIHKRHKPIQLHQRLFMHSHGLGTHSLKGWDPVTYECPETIWMKE